MAIKDLTKVVNIAETEKANLYHKIAEAYRLSNRWVEAVPFYQKAFEAKLTNPEAHFHYAFALKAARKLRFGFERTTTIHRLEKYY